MRRGCIKLCWFSKINFFFYNFDQSSLFFDQSKLRLKISVSLCLFRLIEIVFGSIEYRESGFLKFSVWLVQNTFSKVFFQLFFLSPTRQSKIIQFLSFSSENFARFSSPKAGKSILPFLLHFISCLHAFIWIFRTIHKLGFLFNQGLFHEID